MYTLNSASHAHKVSGMAAFAQPIYMRAMVNMGVPTKEKYKTLRACGLSCGIMMQTTSIARPSRCYKNMVSSRCSSYMPDESTVECAICMVLVC